MIVIIFLSIDIFDDSKSNLTMNWDKFQIYCEPQPPKIQSFKKITILPNQRKLVCQNIIKTNSLHYFSGISSKRDSNNGKTSKEECEEGIAVKLPPRISSMATQQWKLVFQPGRLLSPAAKNSPSNTDWKRVIPTTY